MVMMACVLHRAADGGETGLVEVSERFQWQVHTPLPVRCARHNDKDRHPCLHDVHGTLQEGSFIDTPPCKIHMACIWRVLHGGVRAHSVRDVRSLPVAR
jgi:hypothetical protein